MNPTTPTPDATSTTARRIPVFNFPPLTTHPLYAIAEGVTIGNLEDLMGARLDQLQAMLTMTYGESGEDFRRNNDTLQESYMWACFMASNECRELFRQIEARRAV